MGIFIMGLISSGAVWLTEALLDPNGSKAGLRCLVDLKCSPHCTGSSKTTILTHLQLIHCTHPEPHRQPSLSPDCCPKQESPSLSMAHHLSLRQTSHVFALPGLCCNATISPCVTQLRGGGWAKWHVCEPSLFGRSPAPSPCVTSRSFRSCYCLYKTIYIFFPSEICICFITKTNNLLGKKKKRGFVLSVKTCLPNRGWFFQMHQQLQ